MTNVLSALILPGNKFVVLGSKDGMLILFDINQGKPV